MTKHSLPNPTSQVKRLDLSRRRFIKWTSCGVFYALVFNVSRKAFANQTVIAQRTITDSLGRTVSIPAEIGGVTPSGICAQTMLCMVCPEGLASVASGIDARDAIEYENADMGELTDLPETGLMALGSNSAIEKSKLAWAAPDIILDVGLPKEGLMGDLDRLQAKTGKPCVFVDISFGKLPDAYRIVGDILGVRTRTEQLACYVEDVCARIERGRKDRLGQCAAFYAPRFLGLEAKNSISLQNDVMNFIGASPVASPYDYTGETVDLTILASEDVDLVLFDDTSCLESLTKGEGEAYDIWSALPAVAEGRYVVAPALMHSWFGSMVIAQSIGALWLANVIWPKEYDLDMVHEASIFYELFYGLHCDEEMLRSLIGTYSEEGYAHD